jgi:hypothetical protein
MIFECASAMIAKLKDTGQTGFLEKAARTLHAAQAKIG